MLSPYGVGCIIAMKIATKVINMFPSPYGAWVVSETLMKHLHLWACFRPLTGHGLYHYEVFYTVNEALVSVPLRGMGCISKTRHKSVH